MTKPYFSIVTTTKNCQSTIIQTLNSVKIQTFKDYGILLLIVFPKIGPMNLLKILIQKKLLKNK